MFKLKILLISLLFSQIVHSEEQYEKDYPSNLDGCPIVSLKRKGERLEIIYSDRAIPEKDRKFDGEITIYHYYKVRELNDGPMSWGKLSKGSKVIKLNDSLGRELEYFVTDLRDLDKNPDYMGPIYLSVVIKVIDEADGYLLEFNQYGKMAVNLNEKDVENKVMWLSGCVYRKMRPENMIIPLPK